MQLPIFFAMHTAALNEDLPLDEDTSRHVSQVLRMREGEQLQLTDGKGILLTATLTSAHKKHSAVKITAVEQLPRPARKTTIAISLLKNANRFEWFLEKAAELGIQCIVPLICERTERQHFRMDRMNAILVSAMLQSRQAWLTELNAPVQLDKFIKDAGHAHLQKLIAHCVEAPDKNRLQDALADAQEALILIGPEGDFTPDEISLALQHRFTPVWLGDTRLRTETAGIAAAVILATH
jgi:16S rRNA (uracil1498-N3)-methyltransferase